MAITAMTNSGPPVTEEALAVLESKLEARLPAPYRRFLRKHNGGRPEPEYFGRFTLHTFYSVDSPTKMHDLLANRRRMRKWLPDEIIPIADDDFGNEICLAIKGKNRGKVYFWDHEGAPERVDIRAKYPMIRFKPPDTPQKPIKDDWPGYSDLTLVADSFAEFLDSFHDFAPEDAQVPAKAAGKPPAKTTPAGKQSAGAKPGKKQPAKKPRQTRTP